MAFVTFNIGENMNILERAKNVANACKLANEITVNHPKSLYSVSADLIEQLLKLLKEKK